MWKGITLGLASESEGVSTEGHAAAVLLCRRRLTQDITVSSKRYQRLKGGSAQTNTSSIIQSPYHTPPKQQLHPSLTLSFSFEGSTRFTSLNFPVQADSDIPAPGLFDILHPIPPSDPPQTASTRCGSLVDWCV